MAVGGGGILSGMSPKGFFDLEGAEQLIAAAKQYKAEPPGSVKVHHDATGFFRHVFDTEQEVLDGIRDYMQGIPAYAPKFFRVAEPKAPRFPAEDLYTLVPFNQKQMYNFDEVLARLVDGSEHMEYRPGYGPEIYTGLVKIDGFLVGVIESGKIGSCPDAQEAPVSDPEPLAESSPAGRVEVQEKATSGREKGKPGRKRKMKKK